MTVWYRLPYLAAHSVIPAGERRSEKALMMDEKISALIEGTLKANAEAMRLASAAAMGRLGPEQMAAAPFSVAAAGLRPAFRRVRGNARRLSRRSLFPKA